MQPRTLIRPLTSIVIALALVGLVLGLPLVVRAQEDAPMDAAGAVGTTFTYQVRLYQAGKPANGAYDGSYWLRWPRRPWTTSSVWTGGR